MSIGRVLTATERYLERVKEKAEHEQHVMKVVAVGAGVALCAGALYWVKTSRKNKMAKPGTLAISGGGIKQKDVMEAFRQYTSAYQTNAGQGIADQVRRSQRNFSLGRGLTPTMKL